MLGLSSVEVESSARLKLAGRGNAPAGMFETYKSYKSLESRSPWWGAITAMTSSTQKTFFSPPFLPWKIAALRHAQPLANPLKLAEHQRLSFRKGAARLNPY
jgi:hypothetical protein